jgi:cellulose biosynthesis protein BcsQ
VRTVALYSIKGGVGKTSTAVNLAALAAGVGLRTVIWDLDPQGAATYLLGAKAKVKGGADGLLSGRRELVDGVKRSEVAGLDILPADFSFRDLDTALVEHKRPTRQVAKLVKPLSELYDLMVIDCPPSISLLSENVFEAAELLIVPVVPTTLSLRTLDQLTGFLAEADGHVPKVRAFWSLVDGRKSLHKQVMADNDDPRVLATSIPSTSVVERMGLSRRPVVLSEPRGRAAIAYRALWVDVQNAMSKGIRR